jgi:hypothetical protein
MCNLQYIVTEHRTLSVFLFFFILSIVVFWAVCDAE